MYYYFAKWVLGKKRREGDGETKERVLQVGFASEALLSMSL